MNKIVDLLSDSKENKKGKLIIIESGVDGSGKATQTKMLFDRLCQEGYNVIKVSYPNYESDSSLFVKMYLNGEFGSDAESVDPYVASTFYALDRYVSFKKEWEEFYNNGGIVLADRYTTSNMVHQAAKMDESERDKFLDWLFDLEFKMYKIPVPDEVIFLDVPYDISEKLIENRKNEITGSEKKDIHENNKNYLIKSYDNSLHIVDKYNWKKINCIENEKMKSIENIHEDIYDKVASLINKKDN